MDAKRFVVASLVGMVVVYAVGWLLFDTLFADFYAANAGSATGVDRDPRILWPMLVGALAYAALITYAMTRGGGMVDLGTGVRIGGIVGFLLWATVDFGFYGSTNINSLTTAVVDPLLEFVRGAIAGVVIAWVLGRVPASGAGPA